MNVMTFNLRCDFPLDFANRWNQRKNIVFDVIENYNCDIIGTQEVTNKMFEDISSNISEFDVVGSQRTKKFFVERNDILVNKKHTIYEYKTFWLSENPDMIGSSKWYSLFPRICTMAVVELKENRKVRVFNSHLDCLFPRAREYGLKKIIDNMKMEQEKEPLPTILMGDFNATPNSKLIRNFTNGKLCDRKFVAVQEVNRNLYNKTTMGNFRERNNGVHIDYIFVSEEIEIINAEIIKYNINGKYPSDHYPVMAEINLI